VHRGMTIGRSWSLGGRPIAKYSFRPSTTGTRKGKKEGEYLQSQGRLKKTGEGNEDDSKNQWRIAASACIGKRKSSSVRDLQSQNNGKNGGGKSKNKHTGVNSYDGEIIRGTVKKNPKRNQDISQTSRALFRNRTEEGKRA